MFVFHVSSDLLACASMLPARPVFGEPTSVSDWLGQLQLLQFYPDLPQSPGMRSKEIVCLWTEEEWKAVSWATGCHVFCTSNVFIFMGHVLGSTDTIKNLYYKSVKLLWSNSR